MVIKKINFRLKLCDEREREREWEQHEKKSGTVDEEEKKKMKNEQTVTGKGKKLIRKSKSNIIVIFSSEQAKVHSKLLD